MENIPTWLPVVALALFDENQRVLMQQRAVDRHHGGLWEFPGGKVENGEIPRFALVREIAEELSIALDADQLVPQAFAEEMGDKQVVLFLYTSNQKCSDVQALDGQNWGWFAPQEAQRLDLAPMDRTLLKQLLEQCS